MKENGISITEIMVVLFIMASLMIASVPGLIKATRNSRAKMLIGAVEARIAQARFYAISNNCYAGLKFRVKDGMVTSGIYKDGNGNGILTADIQNGIDTTIGSTILHSADGLKMGIPDWVKKDPEGNPIAGNDPVRFGRGNIISFSPMGHYSMGSLYFTSEYICWVMRFNGHAGVIKTFRIKMENPVWERWQ